jgi:hypothetical protein
MRDLAVLVRSSQAEKDGFKKYLRGLDKAIDGLKRKGGGKAADEVPEAVKRRRERRKKRKG